LASIEDKFANIDNLIRDDDDIQIILKEMKLKTLEDLKLVLKELNSNKTSLYNKIISFGENLENFIKEFNETKEKIIKKEKCELKIIVEITNITKLNDSTEEKLKKLSGLQLYCQQNNSLNKSFSKTSVEEISSENTLLQASKENTYTKTIDIQSILQNIDLSGEYRERLASVTKLLLTTNEVICFDFI
jgi:hypothetical protein